MTTTEIQDVLELYTGAKNAHDVDAVLDACASDAVYEDMSLGASYEGTEELRAFFTGLFASMPDYYGRFEGVAYTAGTAVTWGRWGGTLTDQFFGIPVRAGRKLDVPVVFVCTFRNGKLVGDRGYYDVLTACGQAGVPLEALGLTPPGRGTPTEPAAA